MPHIHTGANQHDFTASAYIVRLDTPRPSLMLHMHKKLAKFLQFGGHVELDEDPWQAIEHELAEESGYQLSQLKLLQPKLRLSQLADANLHPYPVSLQTHKFGGLDHYHTDIAYAFVAEGPPHNKVKVGESKQFKLFNAVELKQAPASLVPSDIKDTGLFILDQCLAEWQQLSAS